MAQKTENTVGTGRAYSNGRSKKNKYSDDKKLFTRISRKRRENKK